MQTPNTAIVIDHLDVWNAIGAVVLGRGVDTGVQLRNAVIARAVVQDLLLDVLFDLLECFRLEPLKLRRNNCLIISIKYVKHAFVFLKIVLNFSH